MYQTLKIAQKFVKGRPRYFGAFDANINTETLGSQHCRLAVLTLYGAKTIIVPHRMI